MEALQRVEREIQSTCAEANSGTHKSSLRRSLASVKPSNHQHRHAEYTDQDVLAAVRVMDEKWDRQIRRLQNFLIRNYCITSGIPLPPEEGDENSPPDTAVPTLELLGKASAVSEASSLSEEMSSKFGLLIEGDGSSEGGQSGIASSVGSLRV
jgi:hypothetical protein